MDNSIKIIGAGIAGLSAGCYLQMNGYDTEIFEKHGIPGGLCTSWSRQGYTFDGCVHWLLGSAAGSPFHSLWSELIDMGSLCFVDHAERVAIEVKAHADRHGNKVLRLYSDISRLEQSLLDISPQDAKPIGEFIGAIRFVQRFEVPPMLEIAPELRSLGDNLKMLKLLPLLGFLNKWGKVTNLSFAGRFRDPFLKETFELMFEGETITMLVMILQLAYYDRKCAGYPAGGSLSLARKLEQAYLELGGKVRYGTAVSEILVESGKACGLKLENGDTVPAGVVISAADWHFTVFEALRGEYADETVRSLGRQEKLKVFGSAVLVSLGVAATFGDAPHLLRFPLDQILETGDGSRYERMEAHIFNYDPTLAPRGKTVISVTLTTKNPDYWIDLRNSDRAAYNEQKKLVAEEVADRLECKLGGIRANLEAVDVATPATFLRYTGNWKGSIQGWFPQANLFAPSPVRNTLPGLMNFYLAGQWLEPGGGLPVALMTGRNIAQVICRKDKKTFNGKVLQKNRQSSNPG